MLDERIFQAVLIPQAKQQLLDLSPMHRSRIVTAIRVFEGVGTQYKNLNSLGNGLFEIKPSGVRAYFKYDPNRNRVIIVGFICLKKTQKAPAKFIQEAHRLIDDYIKNFVEQENEKRNNVR